MSLRRSFALLFLAAGASIANAQPGADVAPPPPPASDPAADPAAPPPENPPAGAPIPGPAPAAEPPRASGVDLGVVEDANSSRGWLMPTALTPPAGTWSFSDLELLIISGAYAVTDRFQLSLTTLLPIVEDMPIFGLLNAKYQFLRAGRLRGAVQGALLYADTNDDAIDSALTAITVGGALTYCFDDDCRSHVSGFVGAGFASENNASAPVMFGASLAVRAGRHVKLIGEVNSAAVIGEIDAAADGFLLWYGVRFTSSFIGVDLGFAKPIYEGSGDDDPLLLGLPFVSFTYRSLGN